MVGAGGHDWKVAKIRPCARLVIWGGSRRAMLWVSQPNGITNSSDGNIPDAIHNDWILVTHKTDLEGVGDN